MKRLIFVLCALLLITACKKKTGETFNYDPCEGKVPFKADFQILEDAGSTGFLNIWTETDTGYRGGSMKFQSVGDYDSIIWQIAYDARTFKNQKSVTLLFSNVGEYYVRMVGYKKVSGCTVNEKSIDSITKKFVLVTTIDSSGYELRKSPICGQWKGFIVGKESDEFTVQLKDWASNGIYMKNLPKGVVGYPTYFGQGGLVPPYSGYSVHSGYKNFAIRQDLGDLLTFGSIGTGKLLDHNTIEIKINYSDTSKPNWYLQRGPQYTFIGKRQ
jgi:hypothetical protein